VRPSRVPASAADVGGVGGPVPDGSYLQASTQLRGLFSEDGTPLHNHASYLGVADLAADPVCLMSPPGRVPSRKVQ
jgi:hypothetical protein